MELIKIAAVVICLFVIPMLITAPSEKDINRCMEITGHSYQACAIELTR